MLEAKPNLVIVMTRIQMKLMDALATVLFLKDGSVQENHLLVHLFVEMECWLALKKLMDFVMMETRLMEMAVARTAKSKKSISVVDSHPSALSIVEMENFKKNSERNVMMEMF